MKTMWFTFFYGTCIPIGFFFSIITLILYYWVDKYNIIRRRTIKEVLSKDVSIEMIDNLEMIMALFPIGNFAFNYQLFGMVHNFDIYLIIISIVWMVLPM